MLANNSSPHEKAHLDGYRMVVKAAGSVQHVYCVRYSQGKEVKRYFVAAFRSDHAGFTRLNRVGTVLDALAAYLSIGGRGRDLAAAVAKMAELPSLIRRGVRFDRVIAFTDRYVVYRAPAQFLVIKPGCETYEGPIEHYDQRLRAAYRDEADPYPPPPTEPESYDDVYQELEANSAVIVDQATIPSWDALQQMQQEYFNRTL